MMTVPHVVQTLLVQSVLRSDLHMDSFILDFELGRGLVRVVHDCRVRR